MKEKLKSAILVILVGASLAQSYLLVFSSPKHLPAEQSVEYVETDIIGTKKTVEELLFPEQIVLHLGNGKHAVLYPNNQLYKEVYKFLKGRTFDNFRRSSSFTTSAELADVRNNMQGVEVRFRDGIPIGVLKSVLQLKGDVLIENEAITRIWIYAKSEEEVKTYFMTDYATYEVRADLNIKDVERMVGFSELQQTYHSDDGEIYLPDDSIEVARYKIPFELMTVEQLQNSLFVDPRNTRNFRNRDGSEIFTDGKRGLQIRADRLWMSYSDPIPAVEARNDAWENLRAAVQFINQHGGWNGAYMAKTIPLLPIVGQQQFVFRQYYDSFPIIGDGGDHFGLIKITLQRGVTANYERSLIVPKNENIERSLAVLPGGKTLDDIIDAYPKKGSIVHVVPAYEPVVGDQYVELNPVWAVELRDGTYDLLK